MMGRFDRASLMLGIGVAAAALVICLAWVPMDTTTGMVEKVRRQVAIGDALAPTVAAAFLFLGGLMVAAFERSEEARRLNMGNLRFLLLLLLVLGFGLTLMRWVGPSLAVLLTENGYRPLRDTVPWKYTGFLAGGTALVSGLIALVERRLSLRALLIGVATSTALIVVYDLPFDDLLLPPGGDV